MVSYVKLVKDTDIISFRGASIADLDNIISHDSTPFSSYSVIYLHVGTNNIQQNSPAETLLLFQKLISNIVQSIPGVNLIVSSILPRLTDLHSSFQTVVETNNLLSEYCHDLDSVSFVPSYKLVMKKGEIQSVMFYDGLHLNDTGVARLRSYICDRFASSGFAPRKSGHGKTCALKRSQFKSFHF